MKRFVLFSAVALAVLITSVAYIILNKSRTRGTASAYCVPSIPFSYEPFLPPEDTTGNYTLFIQMEGDIKIDANGNVFVLDAGNNRIMKYDKNGKFLQQIGSVGQGPGELLNPINFDIGDDGTIYVWNNGNGRIEIFDRNGVYIHSFKIPFASMRCCGMAVDSQGNVYLNSPSADSLITVFSKDGKKIKQFGVIKKYKRLLETKVFNQGSMCFDKANGYLNFMFVALPLFRRYSKDGKLILEKTIKGPEIKEAFKRWRKNKKKQAKFNPQAVSWMRFFLNIDLTSKGDFFAALGVSKSIYHFSENANVVERLILEVDDEEFFIAGLAVSSAGKIFVLNPYDNSIQIIQPSINQPNHQKEVNKK